MKLVARSCPKISHARFAKWRVRQLVSFKIVLTAHQHASRGGNRVAPACPICESERYETVNLRQLA
jgi:hypothetical protein